ncbi:pentapeptide repeat-containing protein [Myroides pelagicus]|uniref:Pentapeptide repeat-containing protein n=1 Tax=Myroides pelagicus TaxID=270914 RepID=A0A7K1GPS6_9FLAO|nr:pentapeptide repeat-containing protein [Myroides pelagicus]MTH30867.1 pentapeptide repeat-containing protein [Myroides pelagicus]
MGEVIYHQDKSFESVNFNGKTLIDREFNNCNFINCNFAESVLNDNIFDECVFENCDFSMSSFLSTGLNKVRFIGCKLMGVDFANCNKLMFSPSYDNCIMDYCSFYGARLKNTSFVKCSLMEVDFCEADLTSACFKESDLIGATFSNTVLKKADFRQAQNIAIDPEYNSLAKAKFTIDQLEGLLYKYNLEVDNNF